MKHQKMKFFVSQKPKVFCGNVIIGILVLLSISVASAATYNVYTWTDLQNIEPTHMGDNVVLMNDLTQVIQITQLSMEVLMGLIQ